VGDVLFTLPVIGILRKNFPDAQIDFLVEPPSDQIVRLHPHLSQTLRYEKNRPVSWLWEIRKRKYDWVLDFHSNGRTLMLTLFSGACLRAGLRAGLSGPPTRMLAYTHCVQTSDQKYIVEQKLDVLRNLGLSWDRWDWDLKIPQAEMQWASTFYQEAGWDPSQGKLIGMAPATRRPIRAWDLGRFAQVAQSLTQKGNRVVLLWGPGEKQVIDSILQHSRSWNREQLIVPPLTSLLELSALIQKCSLVLSLDNGPKNIAVALKVSTITLSGPTNPFSFDPHDDPLHSVIRDEKLFCISCGLNSCPYQHECMQHITPESVVQKIRTLPPLSAAEKVAV